MIGNRGPFPPSSSCIQCRERKSVRGCLLNFFVNGSNNVTFHQIGDEMKSRCTDKCKSGRPCNGGICSGGLPGQQLRCDCDNVARGGSFCDREFFESVDIEQVLVPSSAAAGAEPIFLKMSWFHTSPSCIVEIVAGDNETIILYVNNNNTVAMLRVVLDSAPIENFLLGELSATGETFLRLRQTSNSEYDLLITAGDRKTKSEKLSLEIAVSQVAVGYSPSRRGLCSPLSSKIGLQYKGLTKTQHHHESPHLSVRPYSTIHHTPPSTQVLDNSVQLIIAVVMVATTTTGAIVIVFFCIRTRRRRLQEQNTQFQLETRRLEERMDEGMDEEEEETNQSEPITTTANEQDTHFCNTNQNEAHERTYNACMKVPYTAVNENEVCGTGSNENGVCGAGANENDVFGTGSNENGVCGAGTNENDVCCVEAYDDVVCSARVNEDRAVMVAVLEVMRVVGPLAETAMSAVCTNNLSFPAAPHRRSIMGHACCVLARCGAALHRLLHLAQPNVDHHCCDRHQRSCITAASAANDDDMLLTDVITELNVIICDVIEYGFRTALTLSAIMMMLEAARIIEFCTSDLRHHLDDHDNIGDHEDSGDDDSHHTNQPQSHWCI